MAYSKPQARALNIAFNHRGWVYVGVNSTGGAYHRMIQRLVADGLMVPKFPHKLTAKGLAALRMVRAARGDC